MLNKNALKIIKNCVCVSMYYMHTHTCTYIKSSQSGSEMDGYPMRAHAHGCCGGERERDGRK